VFGGSHSSPKAGSTTPFGQWIMGGTDIFLQLASQVRVFGGSHSSPRAGSTIPFGQWTVAIGDVVLGLGVEGVVAAPPKRQHSYCG